MKRSSYIVKSVYNIGKRETDELLPKEQWLAEARSLKKNLDISLNGFITQPFSLFSVEQPHDTLKFKEEINWEEVFNKYSFSALFSRIDNQKNFYYERVQRLKVKVDPSFFSGYFSDLSYPSSSDPAFKDSEEELKEFLGRLKRKAIELQEKISSSLKYLSQRVKILRKKFLSTTNLPQKHFRRALIRILQKNLHSFTDSEDLVINVFRTETTLITNYKISHNETCKRYCEKLRAFYRR